MVLRAAAALALALAACGGGGVLGSDRFALTARILDDPGDARARVALAALSEAERPTEALLQLEAVHALGGPLGTRWSADDRARYARLLLARARVRLARRSPSALADFERAAAVGAVVPVEELRRAHEAHAVVDLMHVEGKLRARGHAELAQARLDGGTANRSVAQRGALGAWLFAAGAKRAGYDELVAWHDVTPPAARQPELVDAYLRALAWWAPIFTGEVAPPPERDLVGPERCRFGACTPRDADGDPAAELALVEALGAPAIVDPAQRATFLAIAQRYGTVTGRAWGPIVRARGIDVVADDEPVGAVALPIADPHGYAVLAYARRAVDEDVDARVVERILAASLVSPAGGERVARDIVAESIDDARGHAICGATFTALGDPARARTSWQAAVTASPEPRYLVALAEAIARAGDGDAALIAGTTAAAASGDPAATWLVVGRALEEVGEHRFALEALRAALDLAGDNTLVEVLVASIAAARGQGRAELVQRFEAQLAALRTPWSVAIDDRDPTDVRAALAAHGAAPSAVTVARLWVASRWARDNAESRLALHAALAVDDPRRAVIASELAVLAADEPAIVRALR